VCENSFSVGFRLDSVGFGPLQLGLGFGVLRFRFSFQAHGALLGAIPVGSGLGSKGLGLL
ncbi:MAG TPA: hypothetical protein QGI03_01505, partial [Dehalococcoidia bacterium]|nr:hypothetical protein [Dehalococcoidia bacterium]